VPRDDLERDALRVIRLTGARGTVKDDLALPVEHVDLAIAFKKHLAESVAVRSGKPLSKSTVYGTLAHLKRFFQWLALEPGYRARLKYSDAEYFNPSDKDARIATARRQPAFPTLEQVKHVLAVMPSRTEIERRDRALVAFAMLTGARDQALASVRLKHVDLKDRCLHQDAREVNTKFSKTFPTYFFPVGNECESAVRAWVEYLRHEKLWGNDDPLFPATLSLPDDAGVFHAAGLSRQPWKTASPIRGIFKTAFTRAGLPYFNPHSFRHTLVSLGQKLCQTPEDFKAWSQNLGHEGVLTTFTSYGAVLPDRQADILRDIGERSTDQTISQAKVAQLVRYIRTMQFETEHID
jgi:integrase